MNKKGVKKEGVKKEGGYQSDQIPPLPLELYLMCTGTFCSEKFLKSHIMCQLERDGIWARNVEGDGRSHKRTVTARTP